MVVTQFGGPEVLQLQEMPAPTLREHDVLVEVHAAAVNPIDFKIRKGALKQGRSLPFIQGYDVSGVVKQLGSNVRNFAVDDEVYGSPSLMRNGACADLVAIDARTIAKKPGSIDHLHAAALPLVTLAAWEAICDRANMQAGETVMIEGGGGGVGHVAIQLAKIRGCRVIVTASRDESIDLCRRVGADVVINYANENVVDRVKDITAGKLCPVVFDCVGFDVLTRAVACLAPRGRLATIVGAGSADVLKEMFVKCATLYFEFMGSATMYGIGLEHHHEILKQAADLVDAGKLGVHVSRVFDLENLADAHRELETSHATGKIAIRVR